MKVLHVNATDRVGGAAIACWQLHKSLINHQINSRLLVGRATEADLAVAQLPDLTLLEKHLLKITRKVGLNNIHRINTFKIRESQFFRESDILHLHNLHHGYFNYLALPQLAKDKPIVLTFHDMWSITGHCAFSGECQRWQAGCGKCPDLKTYPSVNRDATHLEWHLKKWVYSQSNIAAVIATSRWSKKVLENSILAQFPIHLIPLGIDVSVYEPLESEHCRYILNIPKRKKVLLFSAQNFQDPRKGGDLFVGALKKLSKSLREEILLLTVGRGKLSNFMEIDIPTYDLGFIESDRIKALAYSAADIFVCPSREETFGMTALESLACGTPVVSFRVGAMPDFIETGSNGYVAESLSAQSLAEGIENLLSAEDYMSMSKAARNSALSEGDISLQTQRHIDLYKRLV